MSKTIGVIQQPSIDYTAINADDGGGYNGGIVSQQSGINWSYQTSGAWGGLTIKKNGVVVAQTIDHAIQQGGSFTANFGDTIEVIANSDKTAQLVVLNQTQNMIVHNDNVALNDGYVFTANGDAYSVNVVSSNITPDPGTDVTGDLNPSTEDYIPDTPVPVIVPDPTGNTTTTVPTVQSNGFVDWIKANPLVAGGIGLGLVLLFSNKNKKKRK